MVLMRVLVTAVAPQLAIFGLFVASLVRHVDVGPAGPEPQPHLEYPIRIM